MNDEHHRADPRPPPPLFLRKNIKRAVVGRPVHLSDALGKGQGHERRLPKIVERLRADAQKRRALLAAGERRELDVRPGAKPPHVQQLHGRFLERVYLVPGEP